MNSSPEKTGNALQKRESSLADAPAQVFQPQKLTEIVEMIDLMGKISERMGEDRSGDMGGQGGSSTTGAGQQKATTTRDDLIAGVPGGPIMQQKLVAHIHQEIHALNKEARKLSRSNRRGAAFLLTEVYKKIRHLSSLIEEILMAGADVVKRFYVAVFIDKQSL